MNLFVRVVIALLILAAPAEVLARGRTGRIDIKYVEPKNPEHKQVFQLLKDGRALEKIRDLLSPFRLPRRLLMQTEGCDGVSNAWYDGESVTVCYEYIDDLWKNVPEKTTEYGIAPIDALIGPVLDVFLHEAGHAIFDLLQVPLFGREEDAADQFSTLLMLRFEKPDARRLIFGSAYQYKGDVKSATVTMARRKFADEHGTPAQRFYNLLCIAYGSDKELFGDFVSKGVLPVERAAGCEDEYMLVSYAFNRLIEPSIDSRLERKVFKHKLPPAETRPKRRL